MTARNARVLRPTSWYMNDPISVEAATQGGDLVRRSLVQFAQRATSSRVLCIRVIFNRTLPHVHAF